MEKLFVSVVFLLLSEYIIFCSSECSSQSSRSTTVCNDSACSADKSFINEGIQLLIPSWNFTCQGTIISWFAHVEGNKSVTGLLEFQIFKPETIDADGNVISYTLVHGNDYKGNDAEGSLIKRSVDLSTNPYLLPIRPGYIVGIYLPPNTADILELGYEDEGDTDVYYWTGVENRKCHYSLCSGKVKSSVNLFVGWDFIDASLTLIDKSLDVVKDQDPLYCQGSMDQCVANITTSSISSSTFSSMFQTSPISISSSTQVVAVSSNPHSSISTHSLSVEPNASNENTGISGVTDIQISLVGAVLILMVLIVVLLISFIIMFQVCRKRKQRILNIVVENGQDHATCGHVSTSVNQSYQTHTVLDCEPAHEAIEMKVNSKIGMNGEISSDYNEIYVEMDEFQETSRKDYKKLHISSNAAEYCVPNSSAKKLSQPDNDELYISMNGGDNKVLNQLFMDKAQHDYDYCI